MLHLNFVILFITYFLLIYVYVCLPFFKILFIVRIKVRSTTITYFNVRSKNIKQCFSSMSDVNCNCKWNLLKDFWKSSFVLFHIHSQKTLSKDNVNISDFDIKDNGLLVHAANLKTKNCILS